MEPFWNIRPSDGALPSGSTSLGYMEPLWNISPFDGALHFGSTSVGYKEHFSSISPQRGGLHSGRSCVGWSVYKELPWSKCPLRDVVHPGSLFVLSVCKGILLSINPLRDG